MCRHKIRRLSVLDGAAKGPSYKQRAVSVTLHASWDLYTYVNWLYRKRSTPLNDQTMKIYDNQAIKASMEPSRNAGTWSSGTSKAVFSVRPMLEPYTSVCDKGSVSRFAQFYYIQDIMHTSAKV